MTASEVRSFLSETYWIIYEIRAKKSTIDYYKKVYGITVDFEDNLNKLRGYVRLAKKMIELVPDPTWREVLIKRYVDRIKCEEVADTMYYSRTAIHTITVKACELIASTLPDELFPDEFRKS